jgi:hypothetical protein
MSRLCNTIIDPAWFKVHASCLMLIFLVYRTDKKGNKIFLIYREIQMGSGSKSYMWKGFLYEEMHKYFHHICMRRWLVIYDFAPDPSEFPNI